MAGAFLSSHAHAMKQKSFSLKHNLKPAGEIPPEETARGCLSKRVVAPSPDEVARRLNLNFVKQALLPWREIQRWLAAEAELISEHQMARALQASLVPVRIMPGRFQAPVQEKKSHCKTNAC